MYLKSMELLGFKSFPDKTKLTFEGGRTVIVGPNGSGKSNISDAMRWVLGEVSSKNMRGKRMEDVVFDGTGNRRAMGFAEVSVTFDNTGDGTKLDCPYEEVTVTRRYYRSGESEYLINRKAVRLKDIYELFLNTGVGRDGYSIISQGKISEIISQKGEERRNVFEDAAGIALFRHKKRESERKLSATDDNLNRINDIFVEVESRIGPLEREAGRAKKAIALLESKKQADIQLWLYDTAKIRKDIAEAEDKFKSIGFDLAGAEESVASYEKQSERLFAATQSNKRESENLLREIGRKNDELHSLDGEFKVNEANIKHFKEILELTEKNLEETFAKIGAEEQGKIMSADKIAGYKAELSSLAEKKQKNTDNRTRLQEEAHKLSLEIARALEDINSLEKEKADILARMSVMEKSKNDESGKNRAILAEIEGYERISTDLAVKIAGTEKGISDYEKEIEKTQEELKHCEGELLSYYEKRHRYNDEISSLKLDRDSVLHRSQTMKAMEEQFEGYSGSVRFVMQKYSRNEITDRNGKLCGTVYGPLSKVISVSDRYVTAIETALGANLQNIVVEDEETAKAAMFTLKKADAGRATFFPLTSMRGQSPTSEMNTARGFTGFVAFADELVESDAKFKGVISNLLGRTVVFDTLDNATAMAKSLSYRVRAVTLDGQQINVGGSFSGGSMRRGGNILGRGNEIEKLDKEAEALAKKIASSSEAFATLQKNIADFESERESGNEKKKLLEVLCGTEKSKFDRLTASFEANNTLWEKLKADYGDLIRASERYSENIKDFEARLVEIDVGTKEISTVRDEKDVRRNGFLDEISGLEAQLTGLLISESERVRDIENEGKRSEEADDKIAALQAEVAGFTLKAEAIKVKLSECGGVEKRNREDALVCGSALEELNALRRKAEEGGFEFEKRLNEVNSKIREKMSQKELIFREYTRYENRLVSLSEEQDKLASKLWDDYELTRPEAIAIGYPVIEAADRAGVIAIQSECKSKLRSLGNVDLDSVSKFKEEKERYDYMKAQLDDLRTARNELIEIIESLDSEMKITLVETIGKINENFKQIFTELFGGGSCELYIGDPSNVLESGIEIVASPPGKPFKNLDRLSGGEKSLIAIAIFFAILKVNPTPFCILDEIEAALDEVNVARFTEYMKRYSTGTQFILITHRRGTMEAADRLYGITMPEHGISKILELDISDISKDKGEKWDGIL